MYYKIDHKDGLNVVKGLVKRCFESLNLLNNQLKLVRIVYISDVDECSDGNYFCGLHATCSNTVGSFECICDPGYIEVSGNCVSEQKSTGSKHVPIVVNCLLNF